MRLTSCMRACTKTKNVLKKTWYIEKINFIQILTLQNIVSSYWKHFY
jgi:hypothetical protein